MDNKITKYYTNQYTGKKYSFSINKRIFEKIEAEFNKAYNNFLFGNYGKVNSFGAYGIRLDFFTNIFEFKINNIEIEYDIEMLESNISNNCCDKINYDCYSEYYNGYLSKEIVEEKLINKNIVKYFEIELQNRLEEFKGKINNILYSEELNYNEEEEDYDIVFNEDHFEDVYNLVYQELC
jgi:hypothetical protein